MRLVAITRILNEADLVEAFVRHTAALVDHHIFLDNGSTDGTLEILESLKGEGVSVEIHHNAEVEFAEVHQLNLLFRLAASTRGTGPDQQGADWVIPLDADEFLDVRQIAEGWRVFLANEKAEVLAARVRAYVACRDDPTDELLVTARITHAREADDNTKVILRGALYARGAQLQAGFHCVEINGGKLPPRLEPRLLLAHYAVRSPWQWIAKCVVGWTRVVAGGSSAIGRGLGGHYRGPFETLRDNPAWILRNPVHMELPRASEQGLTQDQLPYLGTPLRYTKPVDYHSRAMAAMMRQMENLALRVGELNEPRARLRHPFMR